MNKLMKRFLPVLLALLLGCAAALAEQNILKIAPVEGTLFINSVLSLDLTRTGSYAEGAVSWSSSSERVAIVDENGQVTCLAPGDVTIYARTDRGRTAVNLHVNRAVESVGFNEERVTLYEADDPHVAPFLTQKVPEGQRVLVLRMGYELSFNPVVLPENASNRRVTAESDDRSVLHVSGHTLEPAAPGECTLTLQSTLNPEVTFTCRVLVIRPASRVTIQADSRKVAAGSTLTLGAAVAPDTATDRRVTWKSKNEAVATVDENGVVTGVKRGTATIVAVAMDGSGRYGTVDITVVQAPETITLKETGLSLAVEQSATLQPTVGPASANDKTVEYLSSNEAVATVNRYGRVTAKAPGTAVITCYSSVAPKVTAQCTVTVYQPVTKITFTTGEPEVRVGSSVKLSWTVAPALATDKRVSFSSGSPDIASVSSEGVVTGLKRGTATITAAALDGSGRKATVRVKVLQPVTGVSLKQDTYRVTLDEGIGITAQLFPSDASDNRMTWTSSDPSVITVSGKTNRVSVYGHRWGTCTITGVTADGGYRVQATVIAGDYNRPLEVTELYLRDNAVKLSIFNRSNLDLARFHFRVEVFDRAFNPLPCTREGSNSFVGYYIPELYAGETTRHGQFNFGTWQAPWDAIGMVRLTITDYVTTDGFAYDIPLDFQQPVTYTDPDLQAPVDDGDLPSQ